MIWIDFQVKVGDWANLNLKIEAKCYDILGVISNNLDYES